MASCEQASEPGDDRHAETTAARGEDVERLASHAAPCWAGGRQPFKGVGAVVPRCSVPHSRALRLERQVSAFLPCKRSSVLYDRGTPLPDGGAFVLFLPGSVQAPASADGQQTRFADRMQAGSMGS